MAVQSAPAPQQATVAQSVPALVINNFAELVALASDKRDIQTKLALERDVRLVRFEDGTIEIALEPGAAKMLVNDLSLVLLRNQIAAAIGVDPLTPEGMTRWAKEVTAVYTQGAFVTAPGEQPS